MVEIIVNQMKTKDEINSNFTEEEIEKFLEILSSTDSDAIITYISVLERIKEIGILRAVGASKKDPVVALRSE